MIEILLSYFIYNVLLGIILTVIQLIKSEGKAEPLSIVLLLLFPAVGLGKWVYSQTIARNEQPTFPKKWFMWKYMIKVNWGYFWLITILPIIFMLLMFFGVAVGGLVNLDSQNLDSFSGIGALLEAGIIMLVLFGSITMAFLLVLPYLILIHLPKTQMRSVERQYFLMQQQAQVNTTPKPTQPVAKPISLLRDIHAYVLNCLSEFKEIPSSRKKELEEVAVYIKNKLKNGESVNLTFICTHNSRRSQFGQVWAAVAAAYYGIKDVQAYSGGTEETAFNKRAVAAIKRVGFMVDGTVGTNPRYSVRFSDEAGAIDCYSKTFDNVANPQKGFSAIMTCSDADENCPIILGSEFRTKITYEDPKVSDRTELETTTYDERCKQIATEMLYLFSKV